MSAVERTGRYGAWAGVASQVILLVTVSVGMTVSQVFEWPTDPVSVVGTTDNLTATAFNAGLALTGLLMVAFAVTLWRVWRPSIAALAGLVGLSFALAGIFPIGSGLHNIATGIFLFGWLLLWWAGIVDWRAGNRLVGAATFALGTAAIGVWLPYDIGVESLQIGYAAAEVVCFAALGLWVVWTGRRFFGTGASQSPVGTESGTGASGESADTSRS